MIDFNKIKFDKNIMYQYVGLISGKDKNLKCNSCINVDGIPYHCNTILIWWIFYYLLDCKDLESAMELYIDNQKKIDDTFRIKHLLIHNTLLFPKSMRRDKRMRYILEMFYNEEQGVKNYQQLILSHNIMELEGV